MRRSFLTALLGVLTTIGCTPLVPFHLGESAEVLRRGQVSLSGSAGGGAAGQADPSTASLGGIGTRIRVGVGHHQELGAEGTAISSTVQRDGVDWGAKLSWKGAPTSWFAAVLGFGYTHYIGSAVGADVALIFSSPTSVRRPVGIFAGARFSLAVPARSDVYREGGLTEALVFPVGMVIEPARAVRLYLEGGFIAAFSQAHADLDPVREVVHFTSYGGYGALTVAFLFPTRSR